MSDEGRIIRFGPISANIDQPRQPIVEILDVQPIDSEGNAFQPPSYEEIIESADESVKEWHRYLSSYPKDRRVELLSELKTQVARMYGFSLSYFDNSDYEILQREDLADSFVWVPTISFAKVVDYLTFLKAAGLNISQGISFQIPMRHNMRPVSLIVYCREPIPGFMPPDQIKDHESVHAVDPNLAERKTADGLILTELIATIGEITGEYDRYSVATDLVFWKSYYEKIKYVTNDLLRVLLLDPVTSYSKFELAEATKNFVRDITMGTSNSEIVRVMMKCKDFSQLLTELKKMFPKRYKS